MISLSVAALVFVLSEYDLFIVNTFGLLLTSTQETSRTLVFVYLSVITTAEKGMHLLIGGLF